MSFVVWALALALGYVVIGKALFLLIDAIQRKSIFAFMALIAGLGVGVVLSLLLMPAALARVETPDTPFVRCFLHPQSELYLGIALMLGLLPAQWIGAAGLKWQDHKRRKDLSKQVKLHLALVTGAVLFSVPFYWLITTSLKPDDRTSMFPPDLIPVQQRRVTIGGEERKLFLLDRDGEQIKVAKMAELANDEWEVKPMGESRTYIVKSASLKPDLRRVMKWSNYTDTLKFLPPEYRMGLAPLWNTVYITLLTMVGTVLSSSLVAFAFARLRWPGRDMLFVILLATMMIPGAVTMLPVFLIFRSLGWVDTLKPLWVPAFFGGGFNIFLLRQFFMTIPNELEEAARIDGCSYFGIYWRIMLPLIKPALAALTIFAFMGSWNNFQGPLIYISSPEKVTLAYALQLFQGTQHGGEPAMMTAAATMVILPVLIVFFFAQRYMIQGVTLTGIKG